jgi:hypothetical protein
VAVPWIPETVGPEIKSTLPSSPFY